MRDRDLADVSVIGQGCWERGSDVAWEDLKWQEEALLHSLGSSNGSVPSLDHSEGSDTESTSGSLLSMGTSIEDARARRDAAVRRQQRAAARLKKRELDVKVIQEVGWRGFKWEESGDGLPRGFRGNVGGPVTEEGLKAIMAKVCPSSDQYSPQFPSASAHRYATLQTYVKNQWTSVLEVRAHAQRIGHFPLPIDLPHDDDERPVPGPRTSSVLLSPHTPPPQLSIIRPSPSSPAGLSALRETRVTVQRPLTHFIPDREPMGIRHGKGVSSPGLIERSPRLSELEDEEDWPPSPEGIKPFSFAVRAGATARDGSEGHGRRSLLGRWGGSMTSFFGGSQGGSGSMIDMQWVAVMEA